VIDERAGEAANPAAEPYLRLAKHFENTAETYREVRLFGPANDAEAWKGACEFLAARSELEGRLRSRLVASRSG
jgi:hypothetical protein